MIELVEVGIDWLTATMGIDEPEYAHWYQSCTRGLEAIGNSGNLLRPATMNGYVGLQAGKVFLGRRDDGAMCRATGSAAAIMFSYGMMANVHYARLDLQATVRLPDNRPSFGAEVADIMRPVLALRPQATRPLLWHVSDENGGYTQYVGKRTSRHFGRAYNKEAESGEEFYLNCWRFEVEFHNDAATSVAEQLIAKEPRLTTAIAATVWKWWADRGFHCPWTIEQEQAVSWSPRREPTEIDRKLTWLKEQVRPTVTLLRSLGLGLILMEALGLADVPLADVQDGTEGE